nr:WD40 repeat domain-containing protein [Oscillochloris trichoides]
MFAINLVRTYNSFKVRSYVFDRPVYTTSLSFDGKLLASGGRDGMLNVRRVNDGKIVYELLGHTRAVLSVAFTPNDDYLVSSAADGTVWVWDMHSGHQIRLLLDSQRLPITIPNFPSSEEIPFFDISINPDSTLAAIGTILGTTIVVEINTGMIVFVFQGHEEFGRSEDVRSVSFSPNGERLATTGNDGTVHIWQLKRDQLEVVLKNPDTNIDIVKVKFINGSDSVIVARKSSAIEVWSISKREMIHYLLAGNQSITTASFSLDGKYFIIDGGRIDPVYEGIPILGHHNTDIFMGSVYKNIPLETLSGHQGYIYSIDFDFRRNTIVSCSDDKTVRIWDVSKLIGP